MAGNDKADALVGSKLERLKKIGGVQRNFFSNPDKSTGIGLL
jgi:hypothetical protein